MVVTVDGVKMDVRWCDAHTSTFDAEGPFSLGALYDGMQKDERLAAYFYNGLPTREEFISLCTQKERWVYAWYAMDGTPMMKVGITDFQGKVGMIHFCGFKAGDVHRFAIAKHCLDTVCCPHGLSALVGLTPKPFRHAWHFAEDVGFKKLAEVPGACTMNIKGKVMTKDGVLTLYTPNGGCHG